MLSTFKLLQKYDVPGPRYTSYPTVPAWTENVGPNDYKKNLGKISSDDPLSLYFHLPFCESLCHFCGCFKIITKDHSRSAPYVEALLKEIDTVVKFLNCPYPIPVKGRGPHGALRPVSQIHFGGGTPNFLQPEELSLIMKKIREHFQIFPDAEIAIEMHPRTNTEAFCDHLKKEGFNRISLGVQDFNESVQTLIHRFQTYKQTEEMVSCLRSIKFSHFNFDLVYGLPGQNEKLFQNTLEKTLKLHPDRLAVYSYAHVPWKSKIQRAFKDSDLPRPEMKLKLFEMAYEFFRKNGYRLIGMDHFAKEDDELFEALKTGHIHRNFMGYSTHADAHQIGFGISSISFVNGNYFQNTKDISLYQDEAGRLLTYRGCLLNQEDRLRRDLITELMCRLCVDIPEFEKRFGISFWKHFAKEKKSLQEFVQDDLLEITDQKILVLGQGKLVIRNIAMCFDEYLEDIKREAKDPVFSRTL